MYSLMREFFCFTGIGLVYVDASVWQMLRGSIIIFAGILSVSGLGLYQLVLHCIPVKSHGFAVSLTVLAMKSRSHADYVISHAFQL